MALREPFMVKTVEGEGDLELKADPGESLKVLDVQVHNPASEMATILVGGNTVGCFATGGTLGNHLPVVLGRAEHSHDFMTSETTPTTHDSFAYLENAGGTELPGPSMNAWLANHLYERVPLLGPQALPQNKTILSLLREKGIFPGYPIETGEAFKINGVAQAGAIQIAVYELYDEGDMKADMENGSRSKTYLWINYGDTGAAVNKTGDTRYDNQISPSEFPSFPYAGDVPAKTTIEIYGCLASDVAPSTNDGTNYTLTKYLKLVRERETLFDKERKGIPLIATAKDASGDINIIGEGVSFIGNYSPIDSRLPLMFPTKLIFTPGVSLDMFLTTEAVGTGQDITTDLQRIGLICKRIKE